MPMARPPEFDRDEALMKAMHLFWEQGYERTTVRDLTEAMGISAPSLYNSFGGKQSLYDEAVSSYTNRPESVVEPALGERSARAFFARMLETAVNEYGSDEHPRGCLVISDPILGVVRQAGRDAIRGRLEQAQRDGDLAAAEELDALTDYIDVVLRGMSSLARDGADRDALRAAADVALRAWPRRPRRPSPS